MEFDRDKRGLVNFQTNCQRINNRNCTFDTGVYHPQKFVTTIKSHNNHHVRKNTVIGTNNVNNQRGGGYEPSEIIEMDEDNEPDEDSVYQEQIGGAIAKISQSPFRSFNKIYIMADATDPALINSYHNRLDKLGISARERAKLRPHISLMEIHVNNKNPDSGYILDLNGKLNRNLSRILTTQYALLSPQMYILSKKGKYDIMGDFIAKVYKSHNSMYITHFRMAFYKYVENILGKGSRTTKIVNGKKYIVYSYRGRGLLAIPAYYHGKGVWTPHLSLIRLDKVQRSIPALYKAYQMYGVNALIHAMMGVKGSMDTFNMSFHFNRLRISVV
jgi:hypothetical protein